MTCVVVLFTSTVNVPTPLLTSLLQLYSESKGYNENFNMLSRGRARWN